jgi:hypothetical protein
MEYLAVEEQQRPFKPRTKTVEVDGREYQVRRLPADEGSWIYYRMLGACSKAASEQPQQGQQTDAPAPVMSGEERARTLCAIALMYLDFQTSKFTLQRSLQCVSRQEVNAGVRAAMPVVTTDGRWAITELEHDMVTTTKLMVEVLVFSLSDFFQETGDKKNT